MEITLNNQTQIISEGTILYDIIFAQLNEKQNGVAVAVNNSVIPKQQWQSTIINQNDKILIIKATQGG
ncbi:MAG: sulfur carrier protein ThiS [Bacteroidota bacterium]|nr:sulfur carrier protein ThiS [Bacteroidota bacterium]MDP3144188.1 sulfur carrier protein ThiS [Bacteroidota bacterium]MDP3558293.1 sulfur carrier protein ThiS [Bacteroidota bacterium]